jgi:hypothetical protein
VDKITVVCHKDHDKGYEDYVGKCLLCEVERLQKREWVGLTEEEFSDLLYFDGRLDHVEVPLIADFIRAIQAKLKEKNSGS